MTGARWLRAGSAGVLGVVASACSSSEAATGSSGSGGSAGTSHTADAAWDVSHEPDAPAPCIASRGTADVSGTYPGGTFHSEYAVFHQTSGECPTSLLLVLTEAPALLGRDESAWPVPRVTVGFRDRAELGLEGYFEVTTSAATLAPLLGSVDVLSGSYEPTGSLRLATADVELSGTFAPMYCPELDVFCP